MAVFDPSVVNRPVVYRCMLDEQYPQISRQKAKPAKFEAKQPTK
jgi:hypothetical protein